MAAPQQTAPRLPRMRARIGALPFAGRAHRAVFAQGCTQAGAAAAAPQRRSWGGGARPRRPGDHRAWARAGRGRRGSSGSRPPGPSSPLVPGGTSPELVPCRVDGSPSFPLARLANVSSIHRPWGAFLLRLVRELRPASCVELGTAIGISPPTRRAGLALNGTRDAANDRGSAEVWPRRRASCCEGSGSSGSEVVEGRLEEVARGGARRGGPGRSRLPRRGQGARARGGAVRAAAPHISRPAPPSSWTTSTGRGR